MRVETTLTYPFAFSTVCAELIGKGRLPQERINAYIVRRGCGAQLPACLPACLRCARSTLTGCRLRWSHRQYPRCVYTLTVPSALRFFAPEEVEWAEEQVVDVKGEVLSERCYTLTDGLDLTSSFGAWWATISCTCVGLPWLRLRVRVLVCHCTRCSARRR